MNIVVDVPQTVMNHRIDKRRIAHFGTLSLPHQQLRRIGHGFHSTGDDGFVFSSPDAVGRHHGGFQGRPADFVHGHGGGRDGQTRTQGHLTRWILSCARLENLAKNDLVHDACGWINRATGHQFLDGHHAEINGGQRGVCAHEFPDRRPCNAANDRSWLAHVNTTASRPFKVTVRRCERPVEKA